MSEGLKSCGAMFFLMSDCARDAVVPCLLALETLVALEMVPGGASVLPFIT